MRASRVLRTALDTIHKAQNQHSNLNAFISVVKSEAALQPAGDGPLQRHYIAVKDNISTSDLPTTCASRGLERYVSPFDATVVARCRNAGGVIVGKTNLDEFGMGSHSTHSAFGCVKTPSAPSSPDRSPGGSSGGSAVAVATGQCDSAIGTDTGGSVRLPAAYNGVYGFKPSYGLVSRWGVVAYANSLDTVGFLSRDAASTRMLFEQCNVHDPRDPTSLTPSTRQRLSSRARPDRKLRIGVPHEYNVTSLAPEVRQAWHSSVRALQDLGHTIHAVSLPSTQSALSAYYILAPAEASSNLAKYDSVRYGSRPPACSSPPKSTPEASPDAYQRSGSGGELYAHARAHALGPEVRRRILLGSYTLSARAKESYFAQAQRVRRRVARDFDAVFARANPLHDDDGTELPGGVDLLLAPTAPTAPPTLEQVRRMSAAEAFAGDVLTVPASLAGLPVISVPVRSKPGEQVGMQVMGQFGDDQLVLDFAVEYADALCSAA